MTTNNDRKGAENYIAFLLSPELHPDHISLLKSEKKAVCVRGFKY